jgi:hypothetical protein
LILGINIVDLENNTIIVDFDVFEVQPGWLKETLQSLVSDIKLVE